MKKELLQHKLAYTVLLVGLGLLTMLFFAAWPDRWLQRATAGLLGLFYFVWGLTTHLHTRHLNKQIVFEYLAIALLATAILMLITF
ncbi:MAG: hypothetical protein GF390_01935 [Candidatus Pacebacteria bacterium]|nr:hypothetical protein [Candidatus Paceibacterota bacterium]